jgi:hypothetical protein
VKVYDILKEKRAFVLSMYFTASRVTRLLAANQHETPKYGKTLRGLQNQNFKKNI